LHPALVSAAAQGGLPQRVTQPLRADRIKEGTTTVQFYTEVLAFSVKARDRIERSGLGVPIDLVYLDLGGIVVELISYEGAIVAPAPQNEHLGYRMIALEVDDIQKTIYLSTRGIEIVWGPRVRETYSRAEICDPNGCRIELKEWFQ
jgi:hypothetical protein